MEFLLLIISASCLLVGVVGNHAAPLPSETYWKNKLPNTPMPTIVHDLLHPDVQDGKHRHTISEQLNLQKYSENPPLGKSTIIPDRPSNLYDNPATNRHPNGGLYLYANAAPNRHPNGASNLYANAATIRHPNGGLNLYANAGQIRHPNGGSNAAPNRHPNGASNLYANAATIRHPNGAGSNLHANAAINGKPLDNPGASLFFLEKDLHPGAKMNLHFVVSTASGTTFLPQKMAKVTPFSSDKLPQILNKFAISPKSEEAEVINETIMDCEQPAVENEEKYCATSLESLVDFGTSKFGKNVNVLTTEIVGGQRTQTKKQQYAVGSGVRQIVSDNLVACHRLPYLYAVFYCHATEAHTTRTYVVPLVGADGSKIKATAVCHKDTSKWNPDHVAFQVLKVKPGTVPICHFLTEDNIVWVAKNKDN